MPGSGLQMDAAMNQPLSNHDVTEQPIRIQRFTLAERWVHRSLGLVLGVLIVTGTLLFFPALGAVVGNRMIVSTIHEWSGWLVPIPLVLALFSVAFRSDAKRLNRFRSSDWAWLRSRNRRLGHIPVGKFNAGQKLNSALSLGSIIVLFATGMVMFWGGIFSDSIRTGATFVHDWLALAFGILVLGHIYLAYNDAQARMGMRTGYVLADWAQREHPAWADELIDRHN